MEQKETIKNIEKLAKLKSHIMKELEKVIVGQKDVIEEILIAFFSNGHCLIEGVPGLAKTLMVSSLAKIMNLDFNRIQFTPDLMPTDITGTDILSEDKKTGKRFFEYIKGPIFANIILADEINRTPPKTQSALLQAMQEYQITAGNKTFNLRKPYLVLATQNPIEQEGTYPLPEAQLDRFMFNINIGYPSMDEEKEIVKSTTMGEKKDLKQIVQIEEILEMQKAVRKIPVSDHVLDFAVKLVRATRPLSDEAPELIRKWVKWGAGPRASQFLTLAAKVKAALDGRFSPSIEDVKSTAVIVLRHRVLVSFAAEAEGLDSTKVIQELIKEINE